MAIPRSQTQWDPQYPHTGAEEPARLLESEELLWQRDQLKPEPSPGVRPGDLAPHAVQSQLRTSNPDILTARIVQLEASLRHLYGELELIQGCLHTHDWEEGEQDA